MMILLILRYWRSKVSRDVNTCSVLFQRQRFFPIDLQLDTDEMTVENAITRSFDKIVKLHLDPVWHQLSPKTKQLIADIKTLKLMLE